MYSEVLSNYRVIGQCLEWFNMRYLGAYGKLQNSNKIDFPTYLAFIKRKTSRDTGVFAVNMHVEQYDALLKSNIDILQIGFDSIIYLERRDKIAQAISLAKAQATDQWSADTKAKVKGRVNITNTMVTRALLGLVESHEYFMRHLKSKTQFHYYYEDFRSLDDSSYFTQPLKLLDIDINNSVELKTDLKVQSNKQSFDVYTDYLKMIVGSHAFVDRNLNALEAM